MKYFVFLLILITISYSSFGQSLSAKTIATDPHCGSRDGIITVVANGGTGNYSYIWNSIPKQFTATATHLSAGTYTVTVSDGKETTIATATIIDWSGPIPTVKRLYNQYCYFLIPLVLGFA